MKVSTNRRHAKLEDQGKWYGNTATFIALVTGFISTVITLLQLIVMWK